MHKVTLLYGLLFGLMAFNIFINIQTITRTKKRKPDVVFAFLLLFGLVYILFSYFEYLTPYISTYFMYIRFQMWAGFMVISLLILFIHFYLEIKLNAFVFIFIGGLFVIYLLRSFLPLGGLYSEIEGMRLVQLTEIEPVYMIAGTPNLLSYIFALWSAVIPPIYLYIIVIRKMSRENIRKCVFILAGITVLAAGVVVDFYIVVVCRGR